MLRLHRFIVGVIAMTQLVVSVIAIALAPIVAYGAVLASPAAPFFFSFLIAGAVIAVMMLRRDSLQLGAIVWFAIWCVYVLVKLKGNVTRPLPPHDPSVPLLRSSGPDHSFGNALLSWGAVSLTYLAVTAAVRWSRRDVPPVPPSRSGHPDHIRAHP